MHIEQNMVHHLDLFQGGEILVEFEPHILNQLSDLLDHLFGIHVGVLVAGRRHKAFHEVVAAQPGPA